MEYDLKRSITAAVIGLSGLLFVFLSPIRDPIASWTLLLGLIVITSLLIIQSILMVFEAVKQQHLVFFVIQIINFIFVILTFVGIVIGKFLAIWSPFWFLPFGYYLFISFTITYLLFYMLTEMYTLYQKSIRVDISELSTKPIQE